jgi:hypothetical protein
MTTAGHTKSTVMSLLDDQPWYRSALATEHRLGTAVRGLQEHAERLRDAIGLVDAEMARRCVAQGVKYTPGLVHLTRLGRKKALKYEPVDFAWHDPLKWKKRGVESSYPQPFEAEVYDVVDGSLLRCWTRLSEATASHAGDAESDVNP